MGKSIAEVVSVTPDTIAGLTMKIAGKMLIMGSEGGPGDIVEEIASIPDITEKDRIAIAYALGKRGLI